MSVSVPYGVAPGQSFQVQYQPLQVMAVGQPLQAMAVGQPVMGNPTTLAPQPLQMQMQPMQMQQAGVVGAQPMQPVAHFGEAPPPGAPPGGQWKMENYCGPTSWIVACCVPLGVFVCLCPLDTRRVYVVHDGTEWLKYGQDGTDLTDRGGGDD